MAERDVLVVEDDPRHRDVFHQMFLFAGYNCLLAKDGREGVEVFKAGRPPLVVTNLKMPGITGIELLQQVLALDGDAAVIVLTAAADVKTAIACLKLGAHDVIMKPVDMDQLLITTERALERRQLLIERRQYQQAQGQLQEMRQRDVLIVEEERQVREVLHQIFIAAGYKCVLAEDGGEGLQVFRRWRPDLIVTDLRMPMVRGGARVSNAGIELLKQVRQEDPEAAVIVESAAADVKSHIACLKLGAYAYIMKPINMDELLIAAERALERRQLLIERRQRQEGG
jgi:DNA-binding NtrC family response regulator